MLDAALPEEADWRAGERMKETSKLGPNVKR